MKKKLSTIGKIIILLLSATTLFSACGEDKYYTDYYDSTDIYQSYPIINAEQWIWNADLSRYEATATLKDFDQTLYNDAAIVVSTFWKEEGSEIQTNLPYVRTWVDESNIKYIETVGYELVKGTNSIIFYIQDSDWQPRPSSKMKYEFKFTAILKHN
ncbi:MAG: hypothetical protein QM653_04625 [Dysgonomonas sp.]|uniref:hypothetical protein n=1 Tax=Dysgonomonas sp. TaxID=1891233 RepID=UPI0039E3C999